MNWELAFTTSPEQVKDYKTIDELRRSGLNIIKASVPGCFESDLVKNGLEEDFYRGSNILNVYKYEKTHVYYFTEFNAFENDCLHFGCVDTVAEIYVNGELSCKCDDMFIEYVVSENIIEGRNQVVVHIIPPSDVSEDRVLPPYCDASGHTKESLFIRKAPHQFGCDTSPRILTKGLLKPVVLLRKRKCEIKNAYVRTKQIDLLEENATVAFSAEIEVRQDCQRDFKQLNYVAEIRDEKRTYSSSGEISANRIETTVEIPRAKFWWPRNYGKPFLYDAVIKVFDGQKQLCQFDSRIGIRTVELSAGGQDIYSVSGKKDANDFAFYVNGKRVFLYGANWTALDVMHVNDAERLPKAFECVTDLCCNVIRCRGNNVYESEEFYDLCDENGILVWQDFMMSGRVYPADAEFKETLSKEAEQVIKRLRNHPSAAVFCGDDECDLAAFRKTGDISAPDRNKLSRELLSGLVRELCPETPYLPSSPYISGTTKDISFFPEEHLGGSFEFFKKERVPERMTRFISDAVSVGMPSPSSLRQFITRDYQLSLKDPDGSYRDEYVLHTNASSFTAGDIHDEILKNAAKQTELLFGSLPDKMILFLRQSQICQAEALKSIIERCRIDKGHTSGVIWSFLADGWPQISGSVVDYYFNKKLAYSYIKRSQNPLCLMFDGKDNTGRYALHAVNDLQYGDQITYVIKDLTENGKIAASGIAEIKPDSNEILENVLLESKHFYLITWTPRAGRTYTNHYFTELPGVDYTTYITALRKASYNDFDGFDDFSKEP